MYFFTKVVNATVDIDVSKPFHEPLDQFHIIVMLGE